MLEGLWKGIRQKKSCEKYTGEKCRYKRQTLKYDLKCKNVHLVPSYPKIHIASITKLSLFYSWESPQISLFLSPVQATSISSIYYHVGLPTNLPNPPSFFNPQAHIVIRTIVFLSANLIISLSNLKHFMIFHYPKINFLAKFVIRLIRTRFCFFFDSIFWLLIICRFCTAGDIWQCLETVLIAKNDQGYATGLWYGEAKDIAKNSILLRTAFSHRKNTWPQISIVLKPLNPAIVLPHTPLSSYPLDFSLSLLFSLPWFTILNHISNPLIWYSFFLK